MPTIYDVATRAGVSTATVSRALSGVAGAVLPRTREKVLRAVEALGYAPNTAATNLRTLRSGRLLVTVPDITRACFARVVQGVDHAAHRAGYSVLLGDRQDEAGRETRYAQMLSRREADGWICVGQRLPAHVAALVRAAAPRVPPVVNGCELNPADGVPSVRIDHAVAARDVLDHLYGLGHRRIGIITGPAASASSRDRLRGAVARAEAQSAGLDLAIVAGDGTFESGVAAAERLFGRPEPPTAVFGFTDEMAMGVLEAARRRGIGVPDELSIVGFDEAGASSEIYPPLTTVVQPAREIGQTCVRLLLEILHGHPVTPAVVTLPHRLAIRATTGRLAAYSRFSRQRAHA